MSRSESPLGSDATLEMAHHVLKAHIYRESSPSAMGSNAGILGSDDDEEQSSIIPARDLQVTKVFAALSVKKSSLSLYKCLIGKKHRMNQDL